MERADLDKLLKENVGRFYVYQLLKPDGTPFYIGKGIGRRVFEHEAEARGAKNSHKLNTIRLIWRLGTYVDYSIIAFFDSEIECHEREMAEILRIGRHDLKTGPLTNLTNGGEGTVGLSDETRARIDFNLHSEDAPGDRGVANRFFRQLTSAVRSIPVRPINGTAPPRALTPVERTNQSTTERQAAALAASAIANGILLEPGSMLPRRLNVDDTEMIIEFGVCKNLLQSGMAVLARDTSLKHEMLELTKLGFDAICKYLDQDILVDAGVLMPRMLSHQPNKEQTCKPPSE